MSWSRSWAAFSWDLAVCQLHHCHLQRETSSPVNALSISQGARSAIKGGVGPLPPDVRMNTPNSFFFCKFFYFDTAALSCSDLDRLDVGQNIQSLNFEMPWCGAIVHYPAGTLPGLRLWPGAVSAAVVADASAPCTNSPPIMFICTHAATPAQLWSAEVNRVCEARACSRGGLFFKLGRACVRVCMPKEGWERSLSRWEVSAFDFLLPDVSTNEAFGFTAPAGKGLLLQCDGNFPVRWGKAGCIVPVHGCRAALGTCSYFSVWGQRQLGSGTQRSFPSVNEKIIE